LGLQVHPLLPARQPLSSADDADSPFRSPLNVDQDFTAHELDYCFGHAFFVAHQGRAVQVAFTCKARLRLTIYWGENRSRWFRLADGGKGQERDFTCAGISVK
jgi:hypothetical protein